MLDVLSEAGVQRVYGVSGDSLNGIIDSIRTQSGMDWIHVRHEEAAAFAAGTEPVSLASWRYVVPKVVAPGICI